MKAEQLWASILQEAIQGKLVPQLENEPEVNQIGELPEDIPFAIPEKWKWRAFSEAVKSIATKPYQIKSSEVLSEGFIPVVSQSQRSIDGYCNDEDKVIPTELLPIVIFGDHTKVAKYVAFPFIVGADGTKLLRPIQNDLTCEFLYFFVQFMSQKIRNRGYSRHFQFLKSTFIPIPPLKEQVRITARLKKLKPLIEKYGQEQIAIEKLENSFPSLLRLSLLKEAIQGKLVPQLESEPEVETFSSEPDDPPFDIPDKWKWAKFRDVVDVRDGTHDTPKYQISGVPLVTSKNLRNGTIDFNNVKYISEEDHIEISKRSKVEKGDILFAMIGTVGNPAIVGNDSIFSIKNVALFKPLYDSKLNFEFLYYLLLFAQNQMIKESSGGVQRFVSLKYLRNFYIPVPPLGEQQRIVSRIKKLISTLEAL